MRFRPGTQWEKDLLPSIAPIFRIDIDKSVAFLVGTGFWITDKGHLVTARHVIQDNFNSNGKDKGPIFAIQTRRDRSVICRGLSKSDLHTDFDLALSETYAPNNEQESTVPLPMSLHFLEKKDQVCSFAVFSPEQRYENDYEGFIPVNFNGFIMSSYSENQIPIRYSIGFSIGEVNAIFEEKRDSVMLPFPCLETSVRIYGGNSGGPLLDAQGRVCGIHCSSYDGESISYHIPTYGILTLKMTAKSLGIKGEPKEYRTIMDLVMSQNIECIPPLLDENRMFRSCLLWLIYVFKCKRYKEAISTDINFGESSMEVRKYPLERAASTLSFKAMKFIAHILRSNK